MSRQKTLEKIFLPDHIIARSVTPIEFAVLESTSAAPLQIVTVLGLARMGLGRKLIATTSGSSVARSLVDRLKLFLEELIC